MRRILPSLLIAAAVALVAAGCGSDSSGSGGTAATATTDASGAVVVDMKNIQFVPKEIAVKAGTKIKWENLDTVDHDVKADSGADFDSDDFGKGGTYEFTPTKAGTIKYECTLHPGMVGTITVR